jgi:hypothetical protein
VAWQSLGASAAKFSRGEGSTTELDGIKDRLHKVRRQGYPWYS